MTFYHLFVDVVVIIVVIVVVVVVVVIFVVVVVVVVVVNCQTCQMQKYFEHNFVMQNGPEVVSSVILLLVILGRRFESWELFNSR